MARNFLSSLLTLAHLIFLFFPDAALANDGTNAGSQVNHHDQAAKGSSVDVDATTAGSWASFLSPSNLVEGLQNTYLPSSLTGVVETFVAPKQSSSDFWEEAKKYEQTLQDYVPRLLKSAAEYFKSTKFISITSAMNNIIHTTATFRNSIQGALDSRHITLDTLTQEFETIFTSIVHDLENIPHPDKAPGHTERKEMIDKILDDMEAALINLAMRYGIDAEAVTTYFRALRPQVHVLIVAVGDINEQYPQLLPTLATCVAGLLIPESWILKPLLSLFGFGPAGPIKGSAAAWLQRYFWGAAVKPGSWFSVLQAAGMGVIPKWAGLAIKAPLAIGGGLLGMLFPSFNRTT